MFVRWDDLQPRRDEQATLPGYRDPAAVRRFDAPEALDTRFYEVRAKSVINKVPDRSRMPFRWTINPYRGCSHACSYCLAGDTAVLMADGRSRRLAELRVGDRIVGTKEERGARRLVETEVHAKWSSIKPAWEMLLQDGAQLIASGEHRFLSSEGWRHVAPADPDAAQRPHLAEGSVLLGPGGFVPGPSRDRDYMRGYVTGMIRGDGLPGVREETVPARGDVRAGQFRLVLADGEALGRTELYLADLEASHERRQLAVGAGGGRAVAAGHPGQRLRRERIGPLIAWPLLPSGSWTKGFLAGIFDAQGSASGALRLSSEDAETAGWIGRSLERLGFAHDRERGDASRVRRVRLRGGLSERMRFLHETDPASTGRRSVVGEALGPGTGLRVASLRALGTVMRMYDITTGTGDFIANGVVSHNCFARPTHTYLGFDAGRDFEREIVVKVNAPEVARAQLARGSWRGEHVALGTNTDPYQWVEGRYRLMEGIWEAMRDAANPCSILTKSPLLLRDLKLMQEIRARTEFSACLSIPTLDEKAWRATEPRTPNPRARLEAVAELSRAGIPTGVLIAPLMPGINDAPEQVEPLLEAAREAGASNIAGTALHLRGEVREVFMGWMRQARPELVARYQELYRGRAYAPRGERERLARMVRRGGRPGAFWRERDRGTGRHAAGDRAIEIGPSPEPVQGSLF
ncbi:MAG: intein-containing Rv2578c family radical SAM protein [Solirubrobacteraceae bacterium]